MTVIIKRSGPVFFKEGTIFVSEHEFSVYEDPAVIKRVYIKSGTTMLLMEDVSRQENIFKVLIGKNVYYVFFEYLSFWCKTIS